jgi:hypothetical protein
LSFPNEFAGEDVLLRLSFEGEIREELFARDSYGDLHLVLVSPFVGDGRITALQLSGSSLYPAPPTFGFTEYAAEEEEAGLLVRLTRTSEHGFFEKSILIPKWGKCIEVGFVARLSASEPKICSLLLSYGFPYEPDSTYLPGIRPLENDVVGDHVFRAPVAVAQRGEIAAMIFPNLDLLAEHRPMHTILDLDCASSVFDGALMSYGFCAHRVRGHVYYELDFDNPHAVPSELRLGMSIVLDAESKPKAAHEETSRFLWDRHGSRYLDRILPQAMPFAEYAKVCYPAALEEKLKEWQLGWFEHEIDGHICGGVPSGWGFHRGWVSWQAWFNQLRSAYGMRSWGRRLGVSDWVEKADKMLNLALAAQMDRGACPTTYGIHTREWIPSLLQPDNPVGPAYYDLTSMAWKGIWLLRWATAFADCPRRQEIFDHCTAMGDYIVGHQHDDGSIPPWITRDHRAIPVLSHSAQTALPAWFLLVMGSRYRDAGLRACDFLCREVVDGNYYYDFETFFSCSKKPCIETAGFPDHEAMRDPHSLQPPENSLSMQWCAHALRSAFEATSDDQYLDKSLLALERMNLYQSVWPVSYLKTAYTFGGFGVQNSDGEHNDARQAQFGDTLCDFGVFLNRRDLFERGVAAVRASMALINHPLHEKLGIYPNPNYPLGLEPENCCHEGTDTQAGRTGFDWGEGSGLTSMAILLDSYGPVYQGHDWSVVIDGVQ